MADIRRITLVLVLATALALGACGDGGDDSPDSTTTTSTSTTGSTAPADEGAVAAFCAELDRLDVETSEEYVGSEQHLTDVEGLLAVAPDEIRPVLERFRDFVGSGEIESLGPDLEDWPAEVQDDVASIRDFQTGSC